MSGTQHRTPRHRQSASDPAGSAPVASTPTQPSQFEIPGGSGPSASSNGEEGGAFIAAVAQDFVVKVSHCNTIGELLRVIPVPAQSRSKDILNNVYQASQKLGAAEALLGTWRDRLLYPNDWKNFAQLNSLKAPTVQICKEAIAHDSAGLSSLNLDNTLYEAKRAALSRMIDIKAKEVETLRDLVQSSNITQRLMDAWREVLEQQAGAIIAEHAAIIGADDAIRRVAQVAASIGESSSHIAKLSRSKRQGMKKDADISMTDAGDKESQKQLMVLVEEALKRKEQSRRDRTQSGKGKGSPVISKNKTQKKKKDSRPKQKGGKQPKKSSGKQQKKR
jgi:hypothetical protein